MKSGKATMSHVKPGRRGVADPDPPQPERCMKTPVDIEVLLQWAVAQTVPLPWRGVSPRELMFDHGWTVIPRGVSKAYPSAGIRLSASVVPDAQAVLDAVQTLDPPVADMLIACAKAERRPQWFAEPRRVPIVKRHKKRHRQKISGYRIVPPDPACARAAEHAYSRWWDALADLAVILEPILAHWHATGPAASPEPWNGSTEASGGRLCA
jgi:hypothetical protein